MNDYKDVGSDRLHPNKKNRPLASGSVSNIEATILAITLIFISFIIINSLNLKATYILLGYILMNIAYSFYLKHIAILDVSIIASGFVLRLFLGSIATGVTLSMWIVVMTFLLAIFMALAKRRDDFLIYQSTGKKMRKAIDGYNLQFLDTVIVIMASIVIVAYVMYTTSIEVMARVNSEYLYLTTLFVLLGIMRYLQIVFVFEKSGSPTSIVLKDRFIQLVIVGWFACFSLILY